MLQPFSTQQTMTQAQLGLPRPALFAGKKEDTQKPRVPVGADAVLAAARRRQAAAEQQDSSKAIPADEVVTSQSAAEDAPKTNAPPRKPHVKKGPLYWIKSALASAASLALFAVAIGLFAVPGIGPIMGLVVGSLAFVVREYVNHASKKQGLFNVSDLNQIKPHLDEQIGGLLRRIAKVRFFHSKEKQDAFVNAWLDRYTNLLPAQLFTEQADEEPELKKLSDKIKQEGMSFASIVLIGRFLMGLGTKVLLRRLAMRYKILGLVIIKAYTAFTGKADPRTERLPGESLRNSRPKTA